MDLTTTAVVATMITMTMAQERMMTQVDQTQMEKRQIKAVEDSWTDEDVEVGAGVDA